MRPDITAGIQGLVAKAFVLEALSEKPGCTTRYGDLPGKPLADFLIAGINSSAVFGHFANASKKNSRLPIFSYNLQALQVSNIHKSKKYINFGLLEVMFPTVAARIKTDNPELIVDKILEVVKNSTKKDVEAVLSTRAEAWSTSQAEHKIGFLAENYRGNRTVWDFYKAMTRDFPPGNSNFEWAQQYREGLPILRAFFKNYMQKGELLNTTTRVFNEQKRAHPQVAVGILADMCAAAMFL